MKKTRFEKFMLAVTKKALKEESLDTYGDHLKFVRISIELELLKFGGSEGIAAEEPSQETPEKKEKPTKKEAPKKRERPQSRVDQISGALGTTKRTAIRIGIALTKTYDFLATGNNLVIVVIGSLFLYAALVMALEMI